MTDLLGDQRADAGKCHIEGLGKRKRFRENCLPEAFLGDGEGIFLILGVRNEILPAGQNFPDGAHLNAHMFNTIDDFVVVITEDDIAVFSHDLHGQYLMAEVSEIV